MGFCVFAPFKLSSLPPSHPLSIANFESRNLVHLIATDAHPGIGRAVLGSTNGSPGGTEERPSRRSRAAPPRPRRALPGPQDPPRPRGTSALSPPNPGERTPLPLLPFFRFLRVRNAPRSEAAARGLGITPRSKRGGRAARCPRTRRDVPSGRPGAVEAAAAVPPRGCASETTRRTRGPGPDVPARPSRVRAPRPHPVRQHHRRGRRSSGVRGAPSSPRIAAGSWWGGRACFRPSGARNEKACAGCRGKPCGSTARRGRECPGAFRRSRRGGGVVDGGGMGSVGNGTRSEGGLRGGASDSFPQGRRCEGEAKRRGMRWFLSAYFQAGPSIFHPLRAVLFDPLSSCSASVAFSFRPNLVQRTDAHWATVTRESRPGCAFRTTDRDLWA